MTAPSPGDPQVLVHAARLRLEAGDGPGALQLFTESLRLDIGQAAAFFGAGLALELMGDDDGAAASWRHALTLDPALAEAHGALAGLAARRREWAKVRPAAEAALALRPNQPTAQIALALQDMQDDRPADAAQRMSVLLAAQAAEGLQLSQALRIHGDALDRLGRVDEAFAHYARSAGIFRTRYAGACAGPQPMAGLDLCQGLVRQYGAADPALWRPAPGPAALPAAGHAFLIGFPRSGTTLLEQVLAGHPEVVALEERPTLAPAIDAYLDPPTGLAELAHMDEATAERLRADYWARANAFGAAAQGKLFIDKQPFYGLWLPLIAKLFPHAKIIVARRDPRDVVFSCFRNPFRMTPVTYELMDLARGAALYAGVMDSIELFLARADNRAFVYRHEDLVDRFDDVLADLCAFLGLDLRADMARFQAVAQTRDIRTPSANQVTRPLNRDGFGAWRRYAAHMAPILPSLNVLAERYGYPPQ
jgi:tetratricopeptide (TPR) repeat protein